MSVEGRVSLILAMQETTTGCFPSLTTYASTVERYVNATGTKVFSACGTVAGTATTLNVPATLTKVFYWLVENTSTATTGTADVIVAGGPINGTIPRGSLLFSTNGAAGWTPASVTITGTSGTPYKVIAVGE